MGMIFKGLTFGGINSLDYGIFITGEAVYNAPERSVTSIEIEGRNGDLLIDNGRFLNIKVSYPAGCFAETQQDFKEKIELFRNAIVSQISYQRLTDDYNPDEYRLAVYKAGLDVSVAVLHQGGEFTLTFDCKPQRFLTSGETERSIPEWYDLHTDSGSLVTIDNSGGEYVVKSLSTDIEPQQDLNGYDNPWAGGAGKNMVPDTSLQTTVTRTGVTATSSNGIVSFSGTSTSSGAEALMIGVSGETILLKAGVTYYFSANWSDGHTPSTSTLRMDLRVYNGSSPIYAYETDVSGGTYTPTEDTYVRLGVRIPANYAVPSGLKAYPIITTDSDTTYEPYSNICPITGFDSANIYVSPTTSVGDATTYTVSFGSAGTVYGGTLDVVSGQLTVTHGIKLVNELSWTYSPTYTRFQSSISGIKRTGQARMTTMISSSYICIDDGRAFSAIPNGAIYAGGTSDSIYIHDNRYTDPDIFTTAQGSQQIVYPLATPLTYTLTAQQIALLVGENNIWSDTGDTEIEYGKGGYTLFNPTLFDSRPLIELTGAGTLGINNYILTITGSGKLYIDCDTMEAYTITGGIVTSANNRVSLNTTDYPVLRSGLNNIAVGTGISGVKITPRWWRV